MTPSPLSSSIGAVAVLALLAPSPVAASESSLAPAAQGTTDFFGYSVAVDGDLLVASSPGAEVGGFANAGTATVFRRVGGIWTEEQTLVPGNPGPSFFFGQDVAIDAASGVIAVGSYGTTVAGEDFAGSAYVYRWDGAVWVEEQELTSVSAAENDRFGCCVAIDGDVLAVGARFADPGGVQNQGKASVFRYDGSDWDDQQELLHLLPQAGDQFGASLALDGDMLWVGCPQDTVAGVAEKGSLRRFRDVAGSWVEEQTLVGQLMAAGDGFGESVAMRGDLLVVGAPFDDVDSVFNAGSAVVFRHDGAAWVEEQLLTADGGEAIDTFGRDVAVDGDLLVVGADLDDIAGVNNQGAVTPFRWDGAGWVRQPALIASDGEAFGQLGADLDLWGQQVFAGSYIAGPQQQGTLYLFDLTPEAWSDQGCGLAGGLGEPALVGTGTLVAGSANSVDLTGAFPLAIAGLFLSLSSAPTPFKGGTLKPVPPLIPPVVSPLGAAGDLALPFVMPAGVPAGTELHVQWVVQDPTGPLGFTLSNAVLGVTP